MLSAFALIMIAGCANPGPPKPPTLHLPTPAKSLQAERIGDHVVLSWQTSAETTEGQTLSGPITARICREDAPPATSVPLNPFVSPRPPGACRVVHEVTVTPSTTAVPTTVIDPLPKSLATGAPSLMAYEVTLLNVRGRSAGPAGPVYAVSGTAPPPVGEIMVSPRRGGALIRWKPAGTGSAAMQVTRTLLANAAGPIGPGSANGSRRPSSPVRPETATTPQQLTLSAGDTDTQDHGGLIDHGIHDGDTLRYIAQRVLRVELTPPQATTPAKRGRPTGKRPVSQIFELKSEPSPAVTLSFHDTLPPSAPTGLAAVGGGGFGDAPSIDLSWEPGVELDIAGYNVYRGEAESPVARLNSDLVTGPDFRDSTAKPGKIYTYRITAVDQHHNESTPSTPIKAHLQP